MRRAKPPGEQHNPGGRAPSGQDGDPGGQRPPSRARHPGKERGAGTREPPDPGDHGRGRGTTRDAEGRQGEKSPGRFLSRARFEDYSDDAKENHRGTSTGLKSTTVVQKPNLAQRLTGGWRSNSQPARNRKS